jgi:quinolinate synthase
MNTLQKLHDCLKNLSPTVELPEDIRSRAEIPLLRMLEQSK